MDITREKTSIKITDNEWRSINCAYNLFNEIYDSLTGDEIVTLSKVRNIDLGELRKNLILFIRAVNDDDEIII